MNAVPRSRYKHKRRNRELVLKCKFKCYVKPMKDRLGVSPSKGNQGTTRGKEKILLTSVKNSLDLGFDSHRGQNNFFFTSSGSLIPFTRANAHWVFHGFYIAL